MAMLELFGLLAVPFGQAPQKWLEVYEQPAPLIRYEAQAISRNVNRRVLYVRDTDDVWQSPAVTYYSARGDCEDFVILKRAAMIAAGYDPKDVGMLVGFDKVARLYHAVLVFRGAQGWRLYDIGPDRETAQIDASYFRPAVLYLGDRQYLFGKRVV